MGDGPSSDHTRPVFFYALASHDINTTREAIAMWERFFNALMAVVIAGVLWGAIAYQFALQEEPCPLCLLQRLGMLGVASGALLNVRFGARKPHYGLSLLSAFFGGFVALRQISLHVCPSFPTFGTPFWGLSLYTWSFLVFVLSVVYIGILLCLFPQRPTGFEDRKIHWWGHIAFLAILSVACTNIFTTLWECGLGPCAD